MSDPRQDFELEVGDSRYVVRFTNTALANAERLTGKSVPEIALALATGQFGIDTVNRLAFAALEGARRKLRLGGKEWTLLKVEELIEDAIDRGGDFDTISRPVVEAFDAAIARWFPAEDDGEPADPPKAAGTGTGNSEPPSDQD